MFPLGRARGYFVVAGHEGDASHAAVLTKLSFDLLAAAQRMQLPTGQPLRMRLTIHSGPAIAGATSGPLRSVGRSGGLSRGRPGAQPVECGHRIAAMVAPTPWVAATTWMAATQRTAATP